MTREWVCVPAIHKAKVLLVLPCNDGAAHGNYFIPLDARKNGWNTWREADRLFAHRRKAGDVFFAAVDSSILEVPGDIFGALVWETEMHRVRNPTGEDWGPPDWHLYDPSDRDGYDGLVSLTESLKEGLKRLPPTVPRFAVLDPTAYFVALATAVREEGQSDWWSLKGTSDSAGTRQALQATREEVERYFREGAFSPGVESYPPEWVRCLDRLPERWRAFRTT